MMLMLMLMMLMMLVMLLGVQTTIQPILTPPRPIMAPTHPMLLLPTPSGARDQVEREQHAACTHGCTDDLHVLARGPEERGKR